MLTQKMINIFSLSVIVFILHGMEEYFTGLYDSYPLTHFLWANTIFHSISQATFVTVQVMWAIGLIFAVILLTSNKGKLYFLLFIGLGYIFELVHIISAAKVRGYTPGVATTLLFFPINYFYWKELLLNFKSKQ